MYDENVIWKEFSIFFLFWIDFKEQRRSLNQPKSRNRSSLPFQLNQKKKKKKKKSTSQQ